MAHIPHQINARISDQETPGIHLWFTKDTKVTPKSIDEFADIEFSTLISPQTLHWQVKHKLLACDEPNRTVFLRTRYRLDAFKRNLDSSSLYLVLPYTREAPYVSIIHPRSNNTPKGQYLLNYASILNELISKIKEF